MDVVSQLAGGDGYRPPVVDVDPIRRRRNPFAPVEGTVALRDGRPCVCVRCCLVGKIASVEFAYGTVEVVQVVDDDQRESLVGVDLDDIDRIVLNRFRVAAGRPHPCEGEALAADRHDVGHPDREPEVGGHLQILDHGFSAASVPGIHDPSVIGAGKAFGDNGSYGSPVAGGEVRPEAFVYPRRGVLEPRPRMFCLESGLRGIELGECGVHVFEVEKHMQRNSTFLVEAV